MKTSVLNFKVQYADTDAYKVAWHGAYLRWMEAGRVDFLYLNGIDIKALDENEGIVMPVIDLQIRYSKSAKLLEDVIVTTEIKEIKDPFVVFKQTIKNKDGEIFTKATVRGVAIQDGKMLKCASLLFKKG